MEENNYFLSQPTLTQPSRRFVHQRKSLLFIWEREESCEAVEHIDGDHVGFDRTVFSSILRLWDWATLVVNTRSQGTNITMRSYLEQCDWPRGCLASTPPPSNPRYQPQEVPHSHFLLSVRTIAIVAG
ncbi:unnamed protein product [Leuciscus chuanchicus]